MTNISANSLGANPERVDGLAIASHNEWSLATFEPLVTVQVV